MSYFLICQRRQVICIYTSFKTRDYMMEIDWPVQIFNVHWGNMEDPSPSERCCLNMPFPMVLSYSNLTHWQDIEDASFTEGEEIHFSSSAVDFWLKINGFTGFQRTITKTNNDTDINAKTGRKKKTYITVYLKGHQTIRKNPVTLYACTNGCPED